MESFQLLPLLNVLFLVLMLRFGHSSSQVNTTNKIRCSDRERQALLNIKGELVDTNGRLSSWGNDENKKDCCEWRGIQCHNQTNHVTRLDLASCGLQGNLSELLYLDIYWNDCYSENLDWVFHLDSLEHLDLSTTNLTKATNWLEAVSKLTSIKELDLREVALPEIPLFCYPKSMVPRLLPFLISPSTRGNNMAGPIPTFFENMTSLEYLDLSQCDIQGGIPKYFGNMSNLTELNMFGSNLTGDFSELIMNLSGPVQRKLVYLDLSENNLSGLFPNMSRQCKLGKYFPTWIRTQKEIAHIDISNTGISDVLPSWFVPIFPKLMYLNASNNQMYGVSALRDSLLPQSQLRATILDISRNKISASLDFLCYVKESGLLDLSDNLFSGQIPDCFANFQWLRFLNLANNHLSGEIPYSVGSLSALTLLHLRNNSLLGGLPTSMRYCTSLEMIDVGDNRLTGDIPDWIGDSFPKLRVLILRSNAFMVACHRIYVV
ncbi:Receptor-like protein EIX1 [Sesamum angolense]|uniref:Receptor-like protein EIX1 n=1 Tax=Sesamum angolense TaxID=2727404 RepID=A0AAE1TD73_9LAMI|nr:Receptor-like protein EIX1 [Sesamum angolense]